MMCSFCMCERKCLRVADKVNERMARSNDVVEAEKGDVHCKGGISLACICS